MQGVLSLRKQLPMAQAVPKRYVTTRDRQYKGTEGLGLGLGCFVTPDLSKDIRCHV